MRPVPIEDRQVWDGAVRRTIAPPGGNLLDPTCSPVDAVIDTDDAGALRFSTRWVLDEGDLEKLAESGALWVTMYGRQLPVHSVGIEEKL